MRMIGMMAGAAALALVAPAMAQAPATGTATQPGAWGRSGWQQGVGAAPAMVPAPAPAPGAVQTAAAIPADAPIAAPDPAALGPAPVAQPMMPDAPPREHRWMTPGAKVPKNWRDPRYTVADWSSYGFPQPGPGMRWMRYYDDAALLDERGRVVDVRHDVAWGVPLNRAYAAMPPQQPAYMQPPLPVPGTVRTGPHTTVTTTVTTVPTPVMAGGGYYGGQVVSVTPGYVITTTTRSTQVIRRPRASRSKLVRR